MAAKEGSVSYAKADSTYFEKRGLQRYAGVWSLWALGVGAVISGHFSGWNFGFATGGWGGLMVAGIIIGIMYVGLVYCIAEMAPALPHTGAAYSFGRTAMGPWGGFITGLCENVEYVVTPAVVVTFIVAYVNSIFGFDAAYSPILWIVFYLIFLGLNIFGVELSFRVTMIVTADFTGGAGLFLDQRHPEHGLQPLGAQHRSGQYRVAGGQWLDVPDGGHRHPGQPAVRRVVVPGDRAAAIGGRGIGRSQAGHAQGHHPRHADAGRVGVHDRAAESVGHWSRIVQARILARASARRLPGHLWRYRRHRARSFWR